MTDKSVTFAGLKAKLEHLRRYAEWMGPVHAKSCPADDTCNCEWKATLEAVNALCGGYAERLERLVGELRDKLQASADAYDQKHEETGDRYYSGGASVREEDVSLLTDILGKGEGA